MSAVFFNILQYMILKTALFNFFFFLLLMVGGKAAFAQNKIEKEERIKENEVPKIARDWLYDAFEKIRRPKWFKEFSESGYSFEAKFKSENHYHSVEFDSLGNILDVEVQLEWSELANEVKSSIENYFDENLKEYKLIKIQIQYSGKAQDLEDFFDEDEHDGILVQYEIEFSGIDLSDDSRIWEGTFDSSGNFLNKRIIQVSDMDNVIF